MNTALQLSKTTIATFSNFAGISNSMIIPEGNRVRVINEAKTCIAYADIEESFPKEFAIYDIAQFLSALDLVTDGEIEFEDSFLTIKNESNRASLRYNYSDAEFIKPAPPVMVFPYEGAVEFALTQVIIETIKNATDRLKLNTISFVSESGSEEIYAATINEKDADSSNSFKILVGKSPTIIDNEFSFNLSPSLIKSLIKGDYDVTVSPKGISEFKGMGIQYYIALSGKSTFN